MGSDVSHVRRIPPEPRNYADLFWGFRIRRVVELSHKRRLRFVFANFGTKSSFDNIVTRRSQPLDSLTSDYKFFDRSEKCSLGNNEKLRARRSMLSEGSVQGGEGRHFYMLLWRPDTAGRAAVQRTTCVASDHSGRACSIQ